MSKIKILFSTNDNAGVGYYRTIVPAKNLQKFYGDDFEITINKNVNWLDINYLKDFNIIHGHRSFCNYEYMPTLVADLRKHGVITVLDIDDYFAVHERHPVYHNVKMEGVKEKVINNLKLVDYVTTTTPIFAEYIKPFNKNVFVIPNAVDDTENEWNFKNKKESEFIRPLYLAGSSHLADVELLKDSFAKMINDDQIKGKYQVHVCGFDLRGNTTHYTLNEDLVRDLRALNLLNNQFQAKLQRNNFVIDDMTEIPQPIRDKYKGNAVNKNVRPITPKESVWYTYENDIFTTQYKLIRDTNYTEWLHTFDLDSKYPEAYEKQPYIRHKTQPVSKFGFNYTFGDFSLAPIRVFGKIKNNTFVDNDNNRYQFAKSNLKLIEAGIHKLPVIASEVPIYTYDKDFVEGKNIMFVSPERQEKDWYKLMKRLIMNPNQITDMGESAYEVVKNKYTIEKVTPTRASFYKEITSKQ